MIYAFVLAGFTVDMVLFAGGFLLASALTPEDVMAAYNRTTECVVATKEEPNA